jgi:hypothetical protein
VTLSYRRRRLLHGWGTPMRLRSVLGVTLTHHFSLRKTVQQLCSL